MSGTSSGGCLSGVQRRGVRSVAYMDDGGKHDLRSSSATPVVAPALALAIRRLPAECALDA
ncbi:hypothetical protein PYCCODRAFT_1441034 [Trametes coccinea BRFM310]|uniref:Uncharacterized protein n=1 Tax=Trametes coccinea (strain BRFM310) TaxID=1353009 RepID=A0A1Y2I7A2_TRAC3|nr:hypothetical protein PYCCODRAFT_1441034 [Trametes coccinea BRFM310]